MSFGWGEFVTLVGEVKGSAGALLATAVTPRYQCGTIRITFLGTVDSTLAITGFGTGGSAFVNAGVAIPATTLWTGEVAVRGQGSSDALNLNFVVSAAGTYTIFVEERLA